MEIIANNKSDGRVSGLCFSTSATALTVEITRHYACTAGANAALTDRLVHGPMSTGRHFNPLPELPGKFDDDEATDSSQQSTACCAAAP
jgi:hypothetical protein